MVKGWYDEIADLDANNVDAFNASNFEGVGHYTQFVWDSSTKIGCGLTVYGEGMVTYTLVCNYKIAGNPLDKPIYKKGEAFTHCPSNYFCSAKYPGLCTDKNVQDEEESGIFNSAPFVRS